MDFPLKADFSPPLSCFKEESKEWIIYNIEAQIKSITTPNILFLENFSLNKSGIDDISKPSTPQLFEILYGIRILIYSLLNFKIAFSL